MMLSVEKSSVPNRGANYMKEQNEVFCKARAAAILLSFRNS